jgi:hypothetical protein
MVSLYFYGHEQYVQGHKASVLHVIEIAKFWRQLDEK